MVRKRTTGGSELGRTARTVIFLCTKLLGSTVGFHKKWHSPCIVHYDMPHIWHLLNSTGVPWLFLHTFFNFCHDPDHLYCCSILSHDSSRVHRTKYDGHVALYENQQWTVFLDTGKRRCDPFSKVPIPYLGDLPRQSDPWRLPWIASQSSLICNV